MRANQQQVTGGEVSADRFSNEEPVKPRRLFLSAVRSSGHTCQSCRVVPVVSTADVSLHHLVSAHCGPAPSYFSVQLPTGNACGSRGGTTWEKLQIRGRPQNGRGGKREKTSHASQRTLRVFSVLS